MRGWRPVLTAQHASPAAAGYGVMRRELPPPRVALEPTQEPELPAEAKARRDRDLAATPVARR